MVMPLASSLGANQALQPELLLPLPAYSCTSTANKWSSMWNVALQKMCMIAAQSPTANPVILACSFVIGSLLANMLSP